MSIKSKFLNKFLNVFFVLTLLIVIFISIFVLLNYLGVITYSSTPSIDIGFYLVLKNAKIKEGNLVIFPNPRTDLLDSPNLLKRVTKITGSYCTVEGRSAEELEKITGIKGIKSFDSAYFGDIEMSVCKKVVPLKLINYLLVKSSGLD